MANYLTQSVVPTFIPLKDMTKFELFLLKRIFAHDPHNDQIYFFSEENYTRPLEITVDDIRNVLKDETIEEGSLESGYEFLLQDTSIPGDDTITIEVTDAFVKDLFQRIVKRSDTLDRVDIVSSYTCDKMRPDGFGGNRLIIMADSYCITDTDRPEGEDEREDDDELMAQMHAAMAILIELTQKMHRCMNGFAEAVRNITGTPYPWPEMDLVNEEYNALGIQHTTVSDGCINITDDTDIDSLDPYAFILPTEPVQQILSQEVFMPTYTKLSELSVGDTIAVDDGFPCVPAGSQVVVKRRDDGDLYFDCADGKHMLDGQMIGNITDDDTLIGITKIG